MHIDAVIAQIGNYFTSIGKATPVIEFGSGSLPSAPYIVVKQEQGAFRVIYHVLPGQQSILREYTRKHLSNALEDKTLNDSGSYFRVSFEPDDLPSMIIANNDDNTISQERLFRVADRI
jgi:hypothetical protein